MRRFDWLLTGYALIQLLTMNMYLTMLTNNHEFSKWILYEAQINLSDVMFYYECLIFGFIAIGYVRFIFDRIHDDSGSNRHIGSGNTTAYRK